MFLAVLSVLPFASGGTLDLPDLLGRAHVLGNCLLDSSSLSACDHYAVAFHPVPYILNEFFLFALTKTFPVWLVERAALLLLLTIFMSGWYRLYSVVNQKVGMGFIASLILVFNNFYYQGFYSFLLSIALCFWWLSFWWTVREDRRLINQLILGAGLVLIYGIHLAGFIFTALTLALYELYRFVFPGAFNRGEVLKRSLCLIPIGILAVGLYCVQQHYAGSSIGAETGFRAEGQSILFFKIKRLFYPVLNFSKYIELVLFFSITVPVFLSIPIKLWRSLLRNFWFLSGGVFTLLYFIIPDVLHGASDVDLRFLFLGLFFLFLGVGSIVHFRKGATVLISICILLHYSFHFVFHQEVNAVVQKSVNLLEKIPSGKRLSLLSSLDRYPDSSHSRVNPYAHIGSYYLPRGAALVDGMLSCQQNPNLSYFCYRGEWSNQKTHDFQFKGIESLEKDNLEELKGNFDYLLVVGAEMNQAERALSGFLEVASNESVLLFQKKAFLDE